MKFLRYVLLLSLLVGCADDSTPAPGNNTDNNNTSDMSDMAADVADDTNVEPDTPKTPSKLAVDVDFVSFTGVRIGEERRVSVGIRNVGGQDLVVSDVTIGEINRRGDQEIKKGSTWVDSTTIIEPGTFREIEILYAPTDEETDRGTVTIVSDDETNPVFEIRIETINPYPDIESPRLVKFGYAPDTTKRILLYNRGGDPLTIQSAVKSGLGPFTIDFAVSEAPPNVIEKDEAFAIYVTYNPTNTDTHRGTITVVSDDPGEPSIEIALNGQDPTACLSVIPRVADFGEVVAGSTHTMGMTMLNCSNTLGLDITTIELTDDGGGVFSLESLPALPLNIAGFGNSGFSVKAEVADGERVGEVQIESNDASQSPMTVELRVKTP